MRVAAFETSGRRVAVALLDAESGGVSERFLDSGRERGRRLVVMLQELLDEAGLGVADIDLFAAGIGPGSYTGIRVGLALASAMAYASGKPIRGVGSLDVLARAVEGDADRPLVVATNAYRGELFVALYGVPASGDLRSPAGPPVCVAPEVLLARLGPDHVAAGEGAELYAEDFARSGVGVRQGVQARASDLARLAVDELRARGAHDPLSLAPLHLRSVDEEFQKR